jgi:hypothetical protein
LAGLGGSRLLQSESFMAIFLVLRIQHRQQLLDLPCQRGVRVRLFGRMRLALPHVCQQHVEVLLEPV